MHYRLLGIDLDGTLLDSRGRISVKNAAAVARAQAEGVMVVPCTGRAWCESFHAIELLTGMELGVFVTGAAICRIDSGRSIDLLAIDPQLAHQVVALLFDLPEAVLVFREKTLAGHDYLVTGRGELTGNTEWWFKHNQAVVKYQDEVTADDLHHTLRVGVVASGRRIEKILALLQQEMGRAIIAHYFVAVQMPDPDQSMYVLEAFAPGVDKWRGLQWIAAEHEIEDHQIAVIGDEINDVSMLRGAGCGIAMANAVARTRQVARYHTLSNDENGVAYAIDQLMNGSWR